MRYCIVCKKPMYSSSSSIWKDEKNYDIHKGCIGKFTTQRKKCDDLHLGSRMEPRSMTGEENTQVGMPEHVDNHAENSFRYKCICDWSKDDEYGFIPNTNCPAHGNN